MERSVTHSRPAWGDRADFLIAAALGPIEGALEWKWEQLWARRISTNRFEVCCIPFFVYGLALGDEVETNELFVIQRRVRTAGHHTYRAWFTDPDARIEVHETLTEWGYLVEWRYSTGDLIAIDAESEKSAQVLVKYLEDHARAERLIWEIGHDW